MVIAVDGKSLQITMNGIHLYFNMAERPIVNPPAKTLPTFLFPPLLGTPVPDVDRGHSQCEDRAGDPRCAPRSGVIHDEPVQTTYQA